MAKLCPGKSQYVKSTKDLAPAVFRRVVARGARRHEVQDDVPLPSKETDRKKLEKLILEKVHKAADFLPASFLTRGADRSLAVCRVVVPTSRGRAFGTGFLIAPNVIMTNNHVIGSEKEARSATAEFRFEEGETPIVAAIEPDQLFITDKPLDFTIVGCAGQGISDIPHIPLMRNPAIVTRHERVNVIQHPDGRPKEVALHDNKVVRIKDKVIRYETDTEPGSSGSPVFNNDWDLVALHHAGVERANNTAENEGIRIAAIVEHLMQEFRREETSDRQDAVRALLETIEGNSPLLGFFDSFGLPESSLEIQVNDFQGVPEFADIGVWNIEHFNNRVSDSRVRDVATVIDRLNLDIYGLTEVQNGALDRLVAELSADGSRYDFVLRDTRGSQDIAVLYDSDTTTVTRRPDIADRNISRLRRRTSANKTAFPRFPLFAQCTVGHGGGAVEFIMIVVHLKAFGDAQSRARRKLAAEMLAEIIEDIRTTEQLPVVLGGDFNEKIDNAALGAITGSPDLFAMTTDDQSDGAISYVGTSHRSLIDHILVSNDVQLGDISGDDAAVVRLDRSVADFANDVSDHVPIVFRMILRDTPIDVDPVAGNPNAHRIAIPTESENVVIGFD